MGTPILTIDSDGMEVWNRQLDIYGRVRKEYKHNSLGDDVRPFIPFLYQGQYYDFETNLAYNRFRYYSPETGAYISQDPIGLAGENPTLYGYVKDSNWGIDIFGLDILDDIISSPSSIWGKTSAELADQTSSKKGSQKAKIIKISGHSKVSQIQVHPGGGRHQGNYYKISTTSEGKIKVIDIETYKADLDEKKTTYYDKEGNKGIFNNQGKWENNSCDKK